MKLIGKIVIILIIQGFLILPATAQQTYSIEECRTLALEHNVKMKKAILNIQSAEHEKKEAFTKFFPDISGTGMVFNADKGLMEMEMAPGQTMSMLKNGVLGGVTATQPIFAGGQIINGSKLAKVGLEVSQIQKEQTENEVNLTTEQYYWQIVTLKEKRKTLQALDQMLEKLCADVEAAVDAGVTTRNDLLQVQLERNNIASSLINLDNGLELSKLVLAQHIGLNDINIDVSNEVDINEIITSPEQWRADHQACLDLTPEYRLLQSNVKANQLQHKISIGKNLPTVAVGAGYMYDNLMDKNQSFGIVFASVSIPISGWWGGSHAIKKQKLQVISAEHDLEDNSQLLVIKMTKAWNDLQDAYKQIAIAHKSIEQASENLRLNTDYYRAGTTGMSDLLDAQSMLQQNKDKYVDAYSQYQIKKLEYLQATGR